MNKTNLWILTEERPKKKVLAIIFKRYAKEKGIACFIDNIRIIPILHKDKFSFTYKILGLNTPKIEGVYLKIISGKSSFVDYLVFDSLEEPEPNDIPVLVIEETKTGDSESRNTGIFQRATKFVYVDYFYPDTQKIMLYNLQGEQKANATETNIFGTRCLLTLGVEISGKTLNGKMVPWDNIDDLIAFKTSMRRPPAGNVAIDIIKSTDEIKVSGRLVKSGRLSHDPNIGALSLISATLRSLGWEKDIIITLHGLSQDMLTNGNKFIRIANRHNIKLENLEIPASKKLTDYWHYEMNGEKIGTIFLHLMVEEFSEGMSIYENHAGCERGYFLTKEGEKLAVEKYSDRALYKGGDKKAIIALPDLTLVDFKKQEVIDIEGEMYRNSAKGILQLDGFDSFEELYIKKYYPGYSIIRTVVLFGSEDSNEPVGKVSLLLNKKGSILLSTTAPQLFKESLKNFRDYWK
ncbi:hypothetical protein [Salinimicrobium soli]|uniref:hypothetical protein n=1 Tax=Salinimicrobium soli TaxID=1254399 RepID=UPI003AAC49C1